MGDNTAEEQSSIPEKTNDGFSIHVVSAELDYIGGPHHNFLSIRSGGKEHLSLHGFAIDRETGQGTLVGTQEDTLRAVFLDAEQSKELIADNTINGDHVIFQGSSDEVIRKLALLCDAAHFINEQNLVYDPWRPIGTAQNSNSVAYTLVTAMDEKFPEDSEKLWAPGHERILLPKDWNSPYNDQNLSTQKIYNAFMGLLANELKQDEIVEKVKQDPIPDTEEVGADFVREEPFKPYKPAGLQYMEINTSQPSTLVPNPTNSTISPSSNY